LSITEITEYIHFCLIETLAGFNIKVTKILYHWSLLMDQFRFCETHFTTYQGFVADQSAISPFLGGMNHVKIFKGWPPRHAPSELVQLWHKTFPPDQRGQVEMKKTTVLSNKTSTA